MFCPDGVYRPFAPAAFFIPSWNRIRKKRGDSRHEKTWHIVFLILLICLDAALLLLPLLAYARVTIAYFYATEKTALSYVLVFSEPVLTFAVLLILPQMLKLTGVWLAIPAAQALTFCIAVPARRRTQRARELPA